MLVVAAASDDHARNPFATEDIAVGAAADRVRVRFIAQPFEHGEQQFHRGVFGRERVSRVGLAEAGIDGRVRVRLTDFIHVLPRARNEGLQLLFNHAPHLALDERVVRHGVAHEAALDLAHVPGRFAVEAALGQPDDDFGGDRDGRHALLRFEAGMRRAPVNRDVVHAVVRRLPLDTRRRPTAIDDDGDLRRDAAVVHVRRPGQADLLAPADCDLDGARFRPVLDR